MHRVPSAVDRAPIPTLLSAAFRAVDDEILFADRTRVIVESHAHC